MTKAFNSILLLLLFIQPAAIHAAHARKRPTVSTNRRSNNNAYDKQITTFDPQGNLLQLQYAKRAAEKGSSGLFLKLDRFLVSQLEERKEDEEEDGREEEDVVRENGSNRKRSRVEVEINEEIIISVVASSSPSTPNASMHRIHDGIMAKMTGLQGDARLLSRHLRSNALQIHWTEGGCGGDNRMGVSVGQVAKVCAEVQHDLTMRPGARPLAVDGVMFGLDGMARINGDGEGGMRKLGLYQCHLTGVVDECHFCVVGNVIEDRSTYSACINELEMLWKGTHASRKEDEMYGVETLNLKEEEKEYAPVSISDAVVKMSRLLINQQQKQRHRKESMNSFKPAVDVYIMRADSRRRGGVCISSATCVKEEDLEYVGGLFENEILR